MLREPDRRQWLDTDRPDERMTVSRPLQGVRVTSVIGSDRECAELHETHTLCLLHPGQTGIGAEWRSGQRSQMQTGAGGTMVMELGEIHRTRRVHGKVAYSVVQIEPRVVAALVDALDRPVEPKVRATSVSSPRLRTAVMGLIASTAADAHPFELECRLVEVVRSWLALCDETCVVPRDPVVHRGIRRARDAIRDYAASGVAASVRLDALAACAGLSAARFPHAFKQWLGMSPYAYYNLCRLNAGRRMVEAGLQATDVAATLGFSDLPHFSRHFRRHFGLPPSAWSKLLKDDGAVA